MTIQSNLNRRLRRTDIAKNSSRRIRTVRYPHREWDSPEQYARRSMTAQSSEPTTMLEPYPTRASMRRHLYSLLNSRRHVVEWRHPQAKTYFNPTGGGDKTHPHDPWWSIAGVIPPMQDGYFIPIPLTSNAIFPVRTGACDGYGDFGDGSYLSIARLDIYKGFGWNNGVPEWTLSEADVSGCRFSIRPRCHRTYIFRNVILTDTSKNNPQIQLKEGNDLPHFVLRHVRDSEGLSKIDEGSFEPWTWTDEVRPDWSKTPMGNRPWADVPGCAFWGETDGDGREWVACNENNAGELYFPFQDGCENELEPPPDTEFNLVVPFPHMDSDNMLGLPALECANLACKLWNEDNPPPNFDGTFVSLLDKGRQFTLIVNATHFQCQRYEADTGIPYDFDQDLDWNARTIIKPVGESQYAGAYGQVLAII